MSQVFIVQMGCGFGFVSLVGLLFNYKIKNTKNSAQSDLNQLGPAYKKTKKIKS